MVPWKSNLNREEFYWTKLKQNQYQRSYKVILKKDNSQLLNF